MKSLMCSINRWHMVMIFIVNIKPMIFPIPPKRQRTLCFPHTLMHQSQSSRFTRNPHPLKPLLSSNTPSNHRAMASGLEPSSSLLALSLAFLLLPSIPGGAMMKVEAQQRTWCVAKPSADGLALLANINYACSQADCSIMQKGCPCFYPDNLISHASIAMNLYYQSRGKNNWNCYFNNTGLIATTDPSYDQCNYLST